VTTSELERRVAVALKQHAEVAMSGTKTDPAKLERLLADAEGGQKSRRAWIAGAVAAAAAVVVVVWAMGLTTGKPQSISPPPAAPAEPEDVATAYVDAYASYDRPRLKSLLAGNALANWPNLSQANRADEAIEFRVLLDDCTTLYREGVKTRVHCTFDVHALGSEQLGIGPFSNNQFLMTVRGGKITESELLFDWPNNGFSVQMWEPFVAWVTKHYPKDVPVMIDGNNNPRPEATSVALFHQHIADYVAAKSS
jgi:hypothetical protein